MCPQWLGNKLCSTNDCWMEQCHPPEIPQPLDLQICLVNFDLTQTDLNGTALKGTSSRKPKLCDQRNSLHAAMALPGCTFKSSPTLLSDMSHPKFSQNKCVKGVITFSIRLFLSLAKDSTRIKYLFLIQPVHLMMRKPASTRIFITSPVPLCTDLKMQFKNVCRWCY